jgi:hypothetical protein
MSPFQLRHKDKLHEFATMEEAQQFLDDLGSSAGVEFVESPVIFKLLNAPGAPLVNWRDIIREVDKEFDRAESSEGRGAALAVFKSTMDFAETTIVVDDVEKFREARQQHYKVFIVKESVINGNVCVETLDEVTQREIAAGRMAPHMTRLELLQSSAQPAKPPSLWRRILTRLNLG